MLAFGLLPTSLMRGMVLAKISSAGLISIGTLVALLWACILVEHVIVQHANGELARAMVEIRQLRLRKQPVPASLPLPAPRVRPSLG
jgi:hypothetical protein